MTTDTHDLITRTHRNIAAAFVGAQVEVQTDDGLSHCGYLIAVVGYSLVLAEQTGDDVVIDLADCDLIAKVA